MRVAVGATRILGARCLEHLASIVDIIGVDTSLDDKRRFDCTKTAVRLGIPVMSYDEIVEAKPEMFFSLKYPKIIKRDLLDQCKCINLHTAWLPKYKGCNGFYWAIMNNDLVYGTTLMEINDGIDTGDLIAERFCQIDIEDTSGTLMKKVYDLSYQMFKEEVGLILSGSYNTYKQTGNGSYYSRGLLNKEINLKDHWLDIYNKVRACDCQPYEPAFYVKNNKKIYITMNDLWKIMDITKIQDIKANR